jgi:hypothetical protein
MFTFPLALIVSSPTRRDAMGAFDKLTLHKPAKFRMEM